MSNLRSRVIAALIAARVWLTDARRRAIHAALGTLAALGVTVGVVNDVQSAAVVGLAGSVLVLAQGALGLTLLRPSGRAQWFGTVGRGLIYGTATAAGVAGIAFGLWSDAESTAALGIVQSTLTVISAFLSVVNVQTATEPALPIVDDPLPLDETPVPPSRVAGEVGVAGMTRSEYQDFIDGE